MRIPSLLAALALCSTPAFSQIHLGINPTYGSGGYRGLSIFGSLGYGDNWSLAPEYSQFSSDTSNGTFRNLSVRLGYDKAFWGVGVTGGSTFKTNHYSNVSGGADVTVSLSPSGKQVGVHRIGGGGQPGSPSGAGLARVDIGVGALMTSHMQDSSGPGGEATLLQSDLYGFAGASLLGAEISAKMTKSSYDKDLTAALVPGATRVPIDGLMTLANNYPDSSLKLGVELPMLPLITPFITYTDTTYKQVGGTTPGETRGTAFGVRVGLQLLEVHGMYEHIQISGASDVDFTSFGAGLRF